MSQYEEDADDILKEIWATREAFAAAHNYDVRAMFAALREMELSSGRVVIPVPESPAPQSLQEPPLEHQPAIDSR